MVRKAECCCGSCVVELDSEPMVNAVCNCNNCKKRTGSAFGMQSYFRESSFSIVSGKTSKYEISNDFGKQERYFCSKCGTTLYWYAEVFKGFVGVAGGCFIEMPLPEPKHSAMNENKCEWVHFPTSMKKTFTADDVPAA